MKNRFIRVFLSVLCVLFVASAASSIAFAQGQLEKLRVAYTVIAPTQLNVWTAKEMSYIATHN